MAWAISVFANISWIPEGVGGAGLRSTGGMGNVPGMGSLQTAGTVGNAQTLRFQQGEQVVGVSGTPPTATAINNALTAAATDLGSQMTTAAVINQLTGWQSGNP
jgi:hypothetical protein